MSVETEDLRVDIQILQDRLLVLDAMEIIRSDFHHWSIVDWQISGPDILILCHDSLNPDSSHSGQVYESEFRFDSGQGTVSFVSASHDESSEYLGIWPQRPTINEDSGQVYYANPFYKFDAENNR